MSADGVRRLRRITKDFEQRFTGNPDIEQLRSMVPQVRGALEGAYLTDTQIADEVARMLGARFRRGLRSLPKRHRGFVGRLGPEIIEDQYRPMLRQRILASVDLIRLNRDQEIERQLKRFVGWATGSVPSQAKRSDKGELSKGLTKSLQQESFERRRVCIDQGHKLLAAVDDVIALEHGAIAKKWRHVIPHAGYQSREEHLKLDGKVFAVRNNEMLKARRMTKAGRPYAEEVDPQPAVEPYCQCFWEAIYDLEDLPDEMRA